MKNTLDYIEKEELQTKVKICDHLEIVPLMVLIDRKGIVREVVQGSDMESMKRLEKAIERALK